MLLFSQSLEALSIIEEVLKRLPSPREHAASNPTADAADAGDTDRDHGGGGVGVGWKKGLDYLRFDGVEHPIAPPSVSQV